MRRFTFSEWTASLNELAPGQRRRLPPTDARLRPDVRAIEEGRFTEVLLLGEAARFIALTAPRRL